MKTPKTYPISKIQEQFWILAHLKPNDSAYNIPLIYQLKGTLDEIRLKQALFDVIQQHPIIGSRIFTSNGIPQQQIDNDIRIENYFEIVTINKNYSKEESNFLFQNEVHTPFDIEGGYLFRAKLFKFKDSIFLSFVFQHIIIDLHSKDIFTSELSKYYSAHSKDRDNLETPTSNNYFQYSDFSRNWLKSNDAIKMKQQWQDALGTSFEQLKLPYSSNTLLKNEEGEKRIYFEIPLSLSNKIKTFTKKNTLSHFVGLMTGWVIFLHRITGQSRFNIGVPFTNRRLPEFKNTIGCFVNILPLMVEIEDSASLLDIAKQIRQQLLKIHRKQEIPFLEINAMANISFTESIFQTGFTFEKPSVLHLENVEAKNILIERDGTPLDLYITHWETDNIFAGYIEYDSLKFNINTIQQWIQIYYNTIETLCENETNSIDSF